MLGVWGFTHCVCKVLWSAFVLIYLSNDFPLTGRWKLNSQEVYTSNKPAWEPKTVTPGFRTVHATEAHEYHEQFNEQKCHEMMTFSLEAGFWPFQWTVKVSETSWQENISIQHLYQDNNVSLSRAAWVIFRIIFDLIVLFYIWHY